MSTPFLSISLSLFSCDIGDIVTFRCGGGTFLFEIGQDCELALLYLDEIA